jgi:beta-glucosidase
MLHATLCQSLGAKIVRNNTPHAHIGTTFSCSHIEPLNQKAQHIAAAKKIDALLNRLYLEPALGLGFPLEDLPALKRVEKYMQAEDEANFAFDFDFIGIQNYTREIVSSSWLMPYVQARLVSAEKRKVPYTTMGWEVYPKSIYHLLHKYSKYKGVKKIYVTENGAAFKDTLTADFEVKDQERIAFFEQYLHQIHLAKQEGVPVDGYFVWSFLDNFEWAEGFTQRFGLIYTDYHTQNRHIKDSGYWFQSFLRGDAGIAIAHEVLELQNAVSLPYI